MSKGDYHSESWGFDTIYKKKRIRSILELDKMNLNQLGVFWVRYGDIRNLSKLSENSYLFICTDDEKKIALWGKYTCMQLIKIIQNNYPQTYCKTIIFFTPLMKKCKGCFTANFISDGNGQLLVEVYPDSVDNRNLSSRMADRKLDYFFFIDYRLRYASTNNNLAIIKEEAQKLMFYRGYFEMSYASTNGHIGVYYTYFSSNSEYLSLCDLNYLLSYFESVRCNNDY